MATRMTVQKTLAILLRDGFILVFNQDALDVVATAEALIQAGVHNMEVTCRIRKPLEKIAALKKALPQFAVGCASLVDNAGFLRRYNARHADDPLPSVAQAVEAGADYVVSAVGFRAETYERFVGQVALVPGCGSAEQIVRQYGFGANLCKLFPARELGGPAYLRAVDPALHKAVPIVPMGGTNAENMPDYIAAGALVVGGSFSLIDKPALQAAKGGDYGPLAERLRGIKALIDQQRQERWPGLDWAEADVAAIADTTGRDFNV